MQHLNEMFTTQGDYLAFIAVTLTVVAGVALGLRRFRPTARFPGLLWVLVLAVLAAGWLAAQRAGESARAENIALVSAMAPTYAAEMERMGHDRITESTPTNDPVYLELIQAQIRWEKLNPFARDIYTFRKRADGTNILIVDSETDYDRNGDFNGTNESRTPLGTVYPEPDDGLEKAFKGEANFDTEIISDRWGTWVSAFVPMRDAQGKVEAVLGVDFDAKSWLAAIARERHATIWGVAFVLAMVLGGGTGITVLRDGIARRTKAAQRLRESEERLLLTIRQMPLGFVEWDVEANVRRWNPAAERIFGYAADEVKGRKILPLIIAPSFLPRVDEIWSNLLRNDGGMHSINENLTKDGRTIICEWFNTPLVGPDNQVAGVFSIFRDVTEQVNLEKQLQRSERLSAIGQLSAGVAHDFNNILTIIIGHAGVLLMEENVSGETKASLKTIEDAALRAAGLTRQLLAFSRQQAMFPRTLALDKVVLDISSMLSRLISAAVNFKVTVIGHVPPIEADPAMVEQVVTNLVLNARDALGSGGDILVSVEAVSLSPAAVADIPGARPGRFVRLTVRDTGVGIPAENLNRIFEPFFTTKPTGKGTGLGLSVVHGIVQQHNGWISVESVLGKGTAFHVHFPPSDKPAPAGNAVEAPEPFSPHITPKTAQTILFAEDEENVRQLACQILEQAGFIVLPASDGPQALEIWNQYHDQIDLLFTDMVMPNGVTGRELSERLLAERPMLPVIYASGYSLDLTAPGFCESERMVFLQKPYQAQQLIAAVRKCFSQGRG